MEKSVSCGKRVGITLAQLKEDIEADNRAAYEEMKRANIHNENVHNENVHNDKMENDKMENDKMNFRKVSGEDVGTFSNSRSKYSELMEAILSCDLDCDEWIEYEGTAKDVDNVRKHVRHLMKQQGTPCKTKASKVYAGRQKVWFQPVNKPRPVRYLANPLSGDEWQAEEGDRNRSKNNGQTKAQHRWLF